jgi:hypothetical protein
MSKGADETIANNPPMASADSPARARAIAEMAKESRSRAVSTAERA